PRDQRREVTLAAQRWAHARVRVVGRQPRRVEPDRQPQTGLDLLAAPAARLTPALLLILLLGGAERAEHPAIGQREVMRRNLGGDPHAVLLGRADERDPASGADVADVDLR